MSALLQDPLEAELVRERAKEIVAGLRPAAQSESWLDRLIDRLHLGRLLGHWLEGHGTLIEYTLYVLAAATVLGLLVVLVRQLDWQRAQRPGLVEGGAAGEVRERVEALLWRAREARAGGERLLALRLYFAAFVVGLTRRGDLEYREAWTNHELVQRGVHSEKLRATLMPLVLELDGLVYGGQLVSDAHLDRLERLVEGCET